MQIKVASGRHYDQPPSIFNRMARSDRAAGFLTCIRCRTFPQVLKGSKNYKWFVYCPSDMCDRQYQVGGRIYEEVRAAWNLWHKREG